MYTKDALKDMHGRGHESLKKLQAHCQSFSGEELNRELPGFGYPTVRLQISCMIQARIRGIEACCLYCPTAKKGKAV